MFYGLDWIATVPPTLRLANEAFGDASGPIVFGWIVAGHQLGAAAAAFFGGSMRELQGDYALAFQIAGMTAIIAAALSMLIDTDAAAGSRRTAGRLSRNADPPRWTSCAGAMFLNTFLPGWAIRALPFARESCLSVPWNSLPSRTTR